MSNPTAAAPAVPAAPAAPPAAPAPAPNWLQEYPTHAQSEQYLRVLFILSTGSPQGFSMEALVNHLGMGTPTNTHITMAQDERLSWKRQYSTLEAQRIDRALSLKHMVLEEMANRGLVLADANQPSRRDLNGLSASLSYYSAVRSRIGRGKGFEPDQILERYLARGGVINTAGIPVPAAPTAPAAPAAQAPAMNPFGATPATPAAPATASGEIAEIRNLLKDLIGAMAGKAAPAAPAPAAPAPAAPAAPAPTPVDKATILQTLLAAGVPAAEAVKIVFNS